MRISESILEYLRMIGLSWDPCIQKYPFNTRNLICIFIFGLNLICNFGYMICGTKHRANSMLATIRLICAISIFFHLIWKTQVVFTFFNKLDDIVSQRKQLLTILKRFFHTVSFNAGTENPTSQAIYLDSSDKIQKSTRMFKFILPVMPPITAGLMAFFTANLVSGALKLPLLMW